MTSRASSVAARMLCGLVAIAVAAGACAAGAADGVTDFTWMPAEPEIGQWVAFHVIGVPAGDIDAAEWNFGGLGCDGTSTYDCGAGPIGCDVAAFSFATAGVKTVEVVLTVGGVQQAPILHDLTVANTGFCGPIADDLYVVHSFFAAGVAGSTFLHEMSLYNPGWQDESFTVDWLPNDHDNTIPPQSELFSVPAGASLRLDNVLDEVFGLALDVIGSLRISPRPQTTRLSSLGLNVNGGATFGWNVPHVKPVGGLGIGETGHLIGLVEDTDRRTNIHCTNMSDEVVPLDLDLYAGDGTWLELKPFILQPLSSHQVNRIFAAYEPVNGYIEVSHDQPGARVTCNGMVVTNSANDGRVVLLQKPPVGAETLILPRAVHDTAATTDLVLFAPAGNAEARIDFLVSDRDNLTGGYQYIAVQVADRQEMQFDSILDFLGISGTSALRMYATSGIVEFEASESQRPSGSGLHRRAAIQTPAGQIPAHRPASLIHLKESANHRTDIGAANPTDLWVEVTVELFAADGTALGSLAFTVPPLSHHQEDGVFTTIGHPVVDDGYALVRTTTPGGALVAYAVVTDLNTGDTFEHPAELLPAMIFADGFDNGDTLSWSTSG